jgi:hypothetical protein
MTKTTRKQFDTVILEEVTTPAALSNLGQLYTKSDNRIYFQDGAGVEQELLLAGRNIAEMYIFQNTTETVVDTADVFHMLSLTEITAGDIDGWTFEDGTRGDDITAYATSDAGARTKVTTTAAHNLAVGDFISITGTTNYNDLYEVMEVVDANNFTINKAWDTNDDATGTYNRGGTLTAGAGAAGGYRSSWKVTLTPAVNGQVFTGAYCVNGVPCEKCRARDKLGTAADYSPQGSNAFRVGTPIAAGDKIQFIFKNVGGTGNFTIRHGNLNLHRV